MCGIAVMSGVADGGRVREALARMAHRGPDASGIIERSGLVMGHVRLSILDLSPAGHQPMLDGCGNALVFNGEIYNFRDERRRLERTYPCDPWRSQTDTEVVLQGLRFEREAFLGRLDGIFALAWWSAERNELLVARDPQGVKPLYTARTGRSLAFASEVRGLLALLETSPRHDAIGVGELLRAGCIEAPRTLYAGVELLPPGEWTIHRLDTGAVASRGASWRAPEPAPARPDDPHALRKIVETAVHDQLVSDAPIGVFLSGGVDSTIIASVAAAKQPILCLTVESSTGGRDAEVATRTAARLGVEHRIVRATRGDTDAWLADAVGAQDVPSIDGLNTYVISRAARSAGLKVALSGLGADELFGGYPNFGRLPVLERGREWVSHLRVGRGVRSIAALAGLSERTRRAGELLGGRSRLAAYRAARAIRSAASVRQLVPGWSEADSDEVLESLGTPEWIRWAELTRYMRNMLLRDSDVMGMANSLEIRVPFLATPVVDHALANPRTSLDARGGAKAALRSAFRAELSDPGLTGEKIGFSLDVADWMRSSGREFIEACVAVALASGLVDPRAARRETNQFWSGRRVPYTITLSLAVLGSALERAGAARP